MREQRKKRTIATHDAIVSAQIERRWEPFSLFRIKQPAIVRYSLFIISCVALNLTGLLIAQQSSSSMFFLDSIGTALASLLGGLSAGVSTALFSAIMGSVVVEHAEHTISAFPSVGSALVWSVLPRLGTQKVGVGIFHPTRTNGYFRKINQVFIIGILAGASASFCSFVAQYSFFKLDIELNNQAIYAISSGSFVSKNNFVLVAVITAKMGLNFSDLTYQFIYLASSATAHIPDKIISTSMASIIAMGFLKVPRYSKQVKYIDNNLFHLNESFNSPYVKIISYMIFCIFVVWIYAYQPHKLPSFSKEFVIGRNGIIFMSSFGSLILLFSLLRKSIIKSIDPYVKHPMSRKLFYDSRTFFSPMTFQRDVFEDSIKIIAIAFSMAQFIAFSSSAGISEVDLNNPGIRIVNLVIDGIKVDTSIPSISNMVAYNILLLTGMRYGIVAIMRYFGRF